MISSFLIPVVFPTQIQRNREIRNENTQSRGKSLGRQEDVRIWTMSQRASLFLEKTRSFWWMRMNAALRIPWVVTLKRFFKYYWSFKNDRDQWMRVTKLGIMTLVVHGFLIPPPSLILIAPNKWIESFGCVEPTIHVLAPKPSWYDWANLLNFWSFLEGGCDWVNFGQSNLNWIGELISNAFPTGKLVILFRCCMKPNGMFIG